MLTTLLLFNCGPFFALVLIHWMGLRCPYLTRRDIFFAVTVSPDFPESPEAVAVYQKYRRSMWIHTGIALLILILGNVSFLLLQDQSKASFLLLEVLSLLAIIWQIGGLLAAFIKARRAVLPHAVAPSMVREVSLAGEPAEKRSRALSLLYLGPWVILGLSVLYLYNHWDLIPERFPTHWGIDGQADAWSTRSFWGVYGLPIAGALTILFLQVLMFLITIGTSRGKAAKGSRRGELRWMMQATRWFVLGMEYCLATFFALLGGYVPVHAQAGNMSPFMWIVIVGNLLVTFVGVIFFVVLVTRKKKKMRQAELAMADGSPGEAPQGDRTEDKYWKCGGVFYYNPDDPAVWVEKRIGIGWTTNMARPGAWAILGALVVMMLLLVVAISWIASAAQ